MAENKKWSQWDLAASSDIDAAILIPILDGTDNLMLPYGDLTGLEGTAGLLYKIYTDLQATYTSETFIADSINYVNLGSSVLYKYIEIEYTMQRYMDKSRGGLIQVLGSSYLSKVFANDSFMSDQENNDWAIVALETSMSTQLQIKITCDDSDVNDTVFKYRIIKKIPV